MKNLAEIGLGSAPAEEYCAQLGSANYEVEVDRELRAFHNQIKRMILAAGKEIPAGTIIGVRENQHDFGTYFDLVFRFDENDELAAEFAAWLDANVPGEWDEAARDELGLPEEEEVPILT